MSTNGNGTQATIDLDAKTLLEQTSQKKTSKKKEAQTTAIENQTKQEETPIAAQEELDYTPCKSVHQAMLIMCGERIDHNEAVKGLCAVGKVILQVGTERIDFGVMTKETLQIDADAMAFCYECGMESEDILTIALDAKKAWCLGYKTQEALDKTARDKQKRQGKIDKQKALLDKLKNRKA